MIIPDREIYLHVNSINDISVVDDEIMDFDKLNNGFKSLKRHHTNNISLNAVVIKVWKSSINI